MLPLARFLTLSSSVTSAWSASQRLGRDTMGRNSANGLFQRALSCLPPICSVQITSVRISASMSVIAVSVSAMVMSEILPSAPCPRCPAPSVETSWTMRAQASPSTKISHQTEMELNRSRSRGRRTWRADQEEPPIDFQARVYSFSFQTILTRGHRRTARTTGGSPYPTTSAAQSPAGRRRPVVRGRHGCGSAGYACASRER